MLNVGAAPEADRQALRVITAWVDSSSPCGVACSSLARQASTSRTLVLVVYGRLRDPDGGRNVERQE